MLLSGKVKGFTIRKRKLFVIAKYDGIEETIENILASDIAEFEIVGYSFIDGSYNEKTYQGKEVVDLEWVADSYDNNRLTSLRSVLNIGDKSIVLGGVSTYAKFM